MCGRFALMASAQQIAEEFEVPEPRELAPRYNIAPSQPVLAVRLRADRGRDTTHYLWGLIPSWVRDPAALARPHINVRVETALEKPSFRTPTRRRRCLIPASGFFEWTKGGRGRQPWFIHPPDAPLWAFAGIWEPWSGPNGEELETCAILTTEANSAMAQLHERMPLVVPRSLYAAWLDPATEAVGLLNDVRAHTRDLPLQMHPVSPAVNKPTFDAPECIAPVELG
ncbi:MAG: SOS response-associated peptidase [Candidatus Hydrogenedentota bacterium]|jgi:putative SOS response-associated peptidase YedK|uniref:Abasic site processing protein n=1 Tax=Sumerlaea chitinivorans TaxID=2250252 RepID=A0A2Z4Y7P8_SUMC1|nr:hypothetical protein BRCON_2091 [Candidatus Sumerlaea chitinivorans]MCX7963778.1 SOS response-associated peptidase [Candidatus Sumerlaea chitinivorans]RMH25552.1 MAG: SOS response-associated peptidase [Candidatus Hydrogenedentota bacterium]